MRRTATVWMTLAMVLAVVVIAGCTSKKDDTSEATTTTTTELPSECEDFAEDIRDARASPPETSAPAEDAEAPTQTTLPPRCADALFGTAVDNSGSEALKELDPEERLGFAHGACAYATALTVDGTEPPTYKDFVATTSESWGVTPELVEEIVTLAATLCPGQLAPLTDLQTGESAITLRLQVLGNGTAQVSYQAPDGTTVNDEVSVPWDHEVTLGAPSEFSVSARIPDGETSCSIMVGDNEVVEQKATPGENVVCRATANELREAAR